MHHHDPPLGSHGGKPWDPISSLPRRSAARARRQGWYFVRWDHDVDVDRVQVVRCSGCYREAVLTASGEYMRMVRPVPMEPQPDSKQAIRRAGRRQAVNMGRSRWVGCCASLASPPQKPLYRAYQQDPQAVQRWLDHECPAIKQLAERDRAVICFGDEASVGSDFHRGTTWAPVGQTWWWRARGLASA